MMLRIAGDHQKREEAGEDSSLELSEGAWPGQHFDVGLLAFRTVENKCLLF